MSRLALALVLLTGAAHAAEPTLALPNACTSSGGAGTPCANAAACAGHPFAKSCVVMGPGVGTCQVGCGDPSNPSVANRSLCSTGETCVEHVQATGSRIWWCKPTSFRIDLNLLDLAVRHHLEGTDPAFSANTCSLSRNLNALLDQDSDQDFDIFDLDLCVLSFLEQPRCADTATPGCSGAPDLIWCDGDAACGRGSYCDVGRHTCVRECGAIVSREVGVSSLYRECTGFAEDCDDRLGKCVEVPDLAALTCETDASCPPGAYCFLGACAARCYRATDCPDGAWTCSETNRCRPVSLPGAQAGDEVDPQRYSVRFLRDELTLDGVRTADSTGIAIMDLVTRKQVVNDPSVVFGYRLETIYGTKRDTRCIGRTFVSCADSAARPDGETEAECNALQDDCRIEPKEQWLRLDRPFGTVHTLGGSRVAVTLDDAVAGSLTPGIYPAQVRAIFDNGESDIIDVVYTKASPSGRYTGTLTVRRGTGAGALNPQRPFRVAIDLYVGDEVVKWVDLMGENNVPTVQGSLVDTNQGFRVTGRLDVESSFGFAPPAWPVGESDVRFVGIYQADKKRLRIVGFADIAADFCLDEDDSACDDTTKLQARNPFGRRIRRQIEFAGPFEDATGTFHGTYTESIYGLLDHLLTLTGSFVLEQSVADGTPIEFDDPLLQTLETAEQLESLNLSSADVPTGPDIDDVGGAPVLPACANVTEAVEAASNFTSAAAFSTYLDVARRFDLTESEGVVSKKCTAGSAPCPAAFPRVLTFNSGFIQAALESLANLAKGGVSTTEGQAQSKAAYLNIYDVVADWVKTCDDSDAQPAPFCIREDKAACGAALYAKAIASGWVSLSSLQATEAGVGFTGENAVFCDETIALDQSLCPTVPGTVNARRALFTLQEYTRFWSSLAQARKFGADRARSDAFLTLFRNQFNPFVAGTARAYKDEKLVYALRKYDELVRQFVGPFDAWTLLRFPMRAFLSAGQEWVDLMNTVFSDRMNILADVVDMRRRVFMTTDNNDFRFAKHLMQHEYLAQVFLMEVQARWQEELNFYTGSAGRIFEQGQAVLDQLRTTRNGVGLVPNRVFFESTSPGITNWVALRNRIVGDDGAGGLLAAANEAVDDAIGNMQGALSDLDALEDSLKDANGTFASTLRDLCGDERLTDTNGACAPTSSTGLLTPAALSACYCNQLFNLAQSKDLQALKHEVDCTLKGGTGCAGVVQLDCPPDKVGGAVDAAQCSTMKKTFTNKAAAILGTTAGDGSGTTGAAVCAFDTAVTTISVDGKSRYCLGGAMRGKLQDRARLDLERRLILEELRIVATKFDQTYAKFAELYGFKVTTLVLDRTKDIAFHIAGLFKKSTDDILEAVTKAAGAVDCVFVAGLAVGTDCPGGAASSAITVSAASVSTTINTVIENVTFAVDQALEVVKGGFEIRGEALGYIAEMQALSHEVSGLLLKLQLLTQESYNASLELGTMRAEAQRAADGWRRDVTTIASHLVGRESGFVLVADHLVGTASAAFRDLVLLSHETAMAFIHFYNLSGDEAFELVNLAQNSTTLSDVADFVAVLDSKAEYYCAVQGIDCDFASNVLRLRVSLRDRLFPNLRDIVDGKTGKTITAGEQFHNAITSPPYMRRRIRGAYTVDQIELPFIVDLAIQEQSPGGPMWMVDPFGCNQLLTSQNDASLANGNNGTVAVEVIGDNLDGPALHYQLLRGPTDFIRACAPGNVQQDFGTDPVLIYPIRTHIVGYPPKSPYDDLEPVPEYSTTSSILSACMATPAEEGTVNENDCWRHFARDRSLASPDWKLMIPVRVDGAKTDTAWITGDDAPKDEKPLIEDVIVYFRYRGRPVQEN